MIGFEARFWARVDTSDGPFSCWPWIGSRSSSGYGNGTREGHPFSAHRVALEISSGRPLGPGQHALHHCDNPPCCNPAHLFVGSHSDNMRDMVRKGRQGDKGRRGEANGSARLTADDVRAIRAHPGTSPAAAAAFGVAASTVRAIRQRRKWKHVA